MPLFVAALVAARRGRRSSTIVVPMQTPPLWRMVVEEIEVAARRALARLFHRSKWHHRPR
jgi:hypothetical protein